MNVKLVWSTPEGDSLLAYIARVSNPSNQDNPKIEKLISYMLNHKHWSPFEMVSACVEIETTRDIGRQILRHKTFSFQEFSQRYAAVTEPAVFREARLQDSKNRQNSLETCDPDTASKWINIQHGVNLEARKGYEWALNAGIAKEVARAVLPEGMTASRMYMVGTMRSWIHYLQVRTGPETQKEHREIAQSIKEILKGQFPVTMLAIFPPETQPGDQTNEAGTVSTTGTETKS